MFQENKCIVDAISMHKCEGKREECEKDNPNFNLHFIPCVKVVFRDNSVWFEWRQPRDEESLRRAHDDFNIGRTSRRCDEQREENT